jgi:hypothetical protein
MINFSQKRFGTSAKIIISKEYFSDSRVSRCLGRCNINKKRQISYYQSKQVEIIRTLTERVELTLTDMC